LREKDQGDVRRNTSGTEQVPTKKTCRRASSLYIRTRLTKTWTTSQ